MQDYTRYAVYLVPEPGPLAAFGAGFFGWDTEHGHSVPQTEIMDLPRPVSEITARPAKYGFHGTINPPMRLARGRNLGGLAQTCTAVLAEESPVTIDRLRLARLGSFLALVPAENNKALAALAERVVKGLDPFRAPLSATERAKRKPERLSEAQRALLDRWGYPYVLDEFRFHMTLTGPLPHADASQVERSLATVLSPILKEPMLITSLCLCGERMDGRFEVISRIPFGR